MFYIKGSFYIKGCDKACPQLSLLSTIFVFRADPSSEMAALASNLLEHFYSAINGWILMKLDRKQFMNVFYHVCGFCADLSLKVTTLFFDFLNHLCNCWTNLTKLNGEQVLNVVYQDCVFVPICELKYHPGFWLAGQRNFSTSFSLYNDMLLFLVILRHVQWYFSYIVTGHRRPVSEFWPVSRYSCHGQLSLSFMCQVHPARVPLRAKMF